jgi:hypothetical protein
MKFQCLCKILKDLKNLVDYQQDRDAFSLKNLTGSVFFKKTYQDLVYNHQYSLNFLRSYMIFEIS